MDPNANWRQLRFSDGVVKFVPAEDLDQDFVTRQVIYVASRSNTNLIAADRAGFEERYDLIVGGDGSNDDGLDILNFITDSGYLAYGCTVVLAPGKYYFRTYQQFSRIKFVGPPTNDFLTDSSTTRASIIFNAASSAYLETSFGPASTIPGTVVMNHSTGGFHAEHIEFVNNVTSLGGRKVALFFSGAIGCQSITYKDIFLSSTIGNTWDYLQRGHVVLTTSWLTLERIHNRTSVVTEVVAPATAGFQYSTIIDLGDATTFSCNNDLFFNSLLIRANPTNPLNPASNIILPGATDIPLTTNHIFVGNASNEAADVAMSGDVTIVAAGTTTIGNLKVTTAKIDDLAVTNAKIAAATIDLTTKVTGTLPVANGGTGRATLTNHGVLVGAAASAITQLAVGTTDQVLLGATGADPAFSTLTGDITISSAVVTVNKIVNRTVHDTDPNDGDVMTWDEANNYWKYAAGGSSTSFADNVFFITDDGDPTKKIAFQASGITTGTTRTLTVPDRSDTIVVLGGTQTLDSKTLTTQKDITFDGSARVVTNAANLTISCSSTGTLSLQAVQEVDVLATNFITIAATSETVTVTSGKTGGNALVLSGTGTGKVILKNTSSGGVDVTANSGDVTISSSSGGIVISAATNQLTLQGKKFEPGTITHDYDGLLYTGTKYESQAIPPSGTIAMYGAASAPNGWFLCDGSTKSRTTYARLFGIIGTTFGAGDGSTTFTLPDLRGRFAIGDDATLTLGGTGGNQYLQNHVHDLNSHQHVLSATGYAKIAIAAGVGLVMRRQSVTAWTDTHIDTGVGATGESVSRSAAAELGGSTDAATGNTGNPTSATVENRPPYQVVNYIIKY